MELRSDVPRLSGLPPRDVWLRQPDVDGTIQTPLDERNLVDLDALVREVRKTVTPDYTWASPFHDVHHLQWPAPLYIGKTDAETKFLQSFRELSSRKAYVPRRFHQWTHRVTEPPPMPDTEVMRYSIDAERVAVSLAHTAMNASRLWRHPNMPERTRIDAIKRHFERYTTMVDNARLVPPEYLRFHIEAIDITSPDELPVVAKELGRLAIDRIPERRRALIAA